MNYARLNHILIPETKEGRDRLRDKGWLRLFSPIIKAYLALSEEGRAVFAFCMVVGVLAVDVGRSQSYMLWSLLACLLVASLLVRPFYRLRGVSLAVEGPTRVMAGEAAEFRISLSNRGPRDQHSIRVDRPFLPWDGKWLGARARLDRLPRGSELSVHTRASFEARGPHHLDVFSAGALVPLGLCLGPRISGEGARFTVVPRIAAVNQLQLPVTPRYHPGGVAQASLTGESMELMGVRPYRSGDRLRDLHAKTWARTGSPAVREFQQEYFSRVGVVLDTDAAASEEQFEAAISLAAGILAHLSRGEALVDLLVTGDELHPLTMGRSLGFLEQALDLLACVKPGPALNAHTTLDRLRPHLRRLSSVVVVTMGWGAEEQALAEAISAASVGCRSLCVQDAGTGPEANLAGAGAMLRLQASDIVRAARGEGGLDL